MLLMLLQQRQKKRFLHVKAIFSLIESDALGRFHHLIRHFLAALGWQAVHKESVGAGFCQQSGVHLIRGEELFAFIGFRFLTHTGPNIGIDGVGGFYGLDGIMQDLNASAGES
jgi:hypothetical protein